MTKEQIKDVLDKHKKWLNDEEGGERANLHEANLNGVDLHGANLHGADLSGVDLSWADLSEADLSCTDLQGADLRGADLSGVNLSWADLSGADLSGTNGILGAAEYMEKNFVCDEKGYIVYRAQKGYNDHPKHWVFEPGKFLTEVPNSDRCTPCGCGVAFGTLECVKKNHEKPYWKCRINWKDLADTVVPFITNGEGRCARLELLEIVEE